MKYVTPVIEQTRFENIDVITVSDVGSADYGVEDDSNVGNSDLGDIDW